MEEIKPSDTVSEIAEAVHIPVEEVKEILTESECKEEGNGSSDQSA